MTNPTPIDPPRPNGGRDDGGILPIVLVATVVFTLIVGAVAGLVTTGLRYGAVVEDRADRLAAADGGLRYAVERLRNMEDLCTTNAGDSGGFTTIFPPKINGADTAVTCRRVGRDLADIQGWGAVITGESVPSGQDIFSVKGSGTSSVEVKKFRGPVYISDPTRLDFQAKLIVEDGDLWYTKSSCATPAVIPEMPTYLQFEPSFLRGPECNTRTWDQLFKRPTRNVPTAQALATPTPYLDGKFGSCRIFYPGKYSGSIPLAAENYFTSGDYYFENVDFQLKNTTAVFGFPSPSGEGQKVGLSSCLQDAMTSDQTTSGERGGATIWAGGSTKILIDNGGELEIFRRQQNEVYLSFYALELNGAGFIPSTNSYKSAPSIDWIFETKSGSNNDAAIHGLFWAPSAKVSLGNVTNAAVGQLIGGLAIGQVDAQASASATEFSIGVEGTPLETHFLLESTAVKDGRSTTIRAVVQFRPDSRQLAINSWRVST